MVEELGRTKPKLCRFDPLLLILLPPVSLSLPLLNEPVIKSLQSPFPGRSLGIKQKKITTLTWKKRSKADAVEGRRSRRIGGNFDSFYCAFSIDSFREGTIEKQWRRWLLIGSNDRTSAFDCLRLLLIGSNDSFDVGSGDEGC